MSGALHLPDGGNCTEVEPIGPCPKCGRTISRGMGDPEGNRNERVPVLLHAMPPCDHFMATPAEDIVHEMYLLATKVKA